MKNLLFLLILLSSELKAQTTIQTAPINPYAISYLDTDKATYFNFNASVFSFISDTSNGYTLCYYYFSNDNLNSSVGCASGRIKIIGSQNWNWYGKRDGAILAVQVVDSFNAILLRKNPDADLIQIKQ